MTPPRRLRVLFCITSLETGGAERTLVDLVTRLPDRRFVRTVVSLGPKPPEEDRGLVRRLARSDVEVVFLDARSSLAAPCIVCRLCRLLRIHRPDILQTFLSHANLAGTVAGHLAGVPHVVTGIRVAERRRNGHRTLARWTSRWVERHVCVSQSVADFSHRVVGLPRQRLVVIPTGLDLSCYPATDPVRLSELGADGGRRAIVCVGRLTRQKRPDWLLDRADAILAELPEHDLFFVGRGDDAQRLAKRAARLRASDRIHFVGWRADIGAILAAAEMLVLVSDWEGMPRVVLEAMASGKPVVATAVEGIEALLGQTEPAQVVPRAASDFVDRVVTILREPALAERLGSENRARAANRFNVDRMVTGYAALYDSLCHAEGGP